MEDRGTVVEQLIRAAVMAGANHSMARCYPDHAGGFSKLAAKHEARASSLCEEICREAAQALNNAASLPTASGWRPSAR